jgi:hypothetical protein
VPVATAVPAPDSGAAFEGDYVTAAANDSALARVTIAPGARLRRDCPRTCAGWPTAAPSSTYHLLVAHHLAGAANAAAASAGPLAVGRAARPFVGKGDAAATRVKLAEQPSADGTILLGGPFKGAGARASRRSAAAGR